MCKGCARGECDTGVVRVCKVGTEREEDGGRVSVQEEHECRARGCRGHVGPCGAVWGHVEPCGAMCTVLTRVLHMWSHVEPCGAMWSHVEPCAPC